MLNICLQPLQNYSRHYSPHLHYMDKNVIHENNSINSRDITVIWRNLYINNMNIDDSKVLTSNSQPIQCYSHSNWLPNERNLANLGDENCRFARSSTIQITCQVTRNFIPTNFRQRKTEPSAVLLSSISSSNNICLFFHFWLFLLVIFSSQFNFDFRVWFRLNFSETKHITKIVRQWNN